MDIKMLPLKTLVKFVLIPLLVAAGAAFYKYCPWIKQDNPIEEKIEMVIEKNFGHDVDLSPDSKE